MQGDAREARSYDAVLRGRRANLLLTDPPYCLLTRRRKGGDPRDSKSRKIDRHPVVRFDSVREYRAFSEAWLPKATNHLTPDAIVVLWTNFLGRQILLDVAGSCDYRELWGEFVWAKRTKDTAGEQLLRVYEVALVLSRTPKAPLRSDQSAIPWSTVTGYDDEGEGSLWGNHPHHKPFSCLEPLIRTFSRPGDLLLDPFAGSGSIAAAAVRLQRRIAWFELEAEWAERTQSRMTLLTSKVHET